MKELQLPADNIQAQFARIGQLIATVGLEHVGAPHVKHLTGPLWEIRLSGWDGIARALYIVAAGRRVVMVRAFVKAAGSANLWRKGMGINLHYSYSGQYSLRVFWKPSISNLDLTARRTHHASNI